MARLTILGTTELRDAAGKAVTLQTRRMALLVYLALETRRGAIHRDRVLGVFWPERPQQAGRNALSQALNYLRTGLGCDVAPTRRGSDEVRLDLALLECDVCQFLDALEAGDPETALRHYGGSLLPGFYAGVHEVDDWLDRTRDELRRQAADAAWAAADAAARRDESVTAGAFARRAADLAEGDEPAVRRLMTLLAGLGDRAGALEAYTQLVDRLQREYETDPDAATTRLAAEIRDQPAPPALTIERAAVTVSAAELPDTEGDVAYLPTPVRARPRARVLVTAGLMLTFISLWGLTLGDEEASESPLPLGAQLLVEDARGPESVAESLTSGVVRRLAGAQRIHVLVNTNSGSSAATEPLFLLRTTVHADADSLRVTALLTDRHRGAAVASTRLSAAADGRNAMEQVAAGVASFARRATGDELERRAAELASVPAAARRALQLARTDIAHADSLYDAGLRDAARVRLAAADSLLAAAQRIDPRWITPVLERGEVELQRWWVWMTVPGGSVRAREALARGIAHADAALRIAPADGRALEIRGVLRSLLWHTTPQDSVSHVDFLEDAAYQDLTLATSSASAAPRAWKYLSMLHYARGEYARAYHAADRALAADAFLDDANGVRTQHFWAALESGDMAAAERSCMQQGVDHPDSFHSSYCQLVLLAWSKTPAGLEEAADVLRTARSDPFGELNAGSLDALHAVLLAQHGDSAEARRLLARVETRADSEPELLSEAAWVYVSLGERDRARELLDRYVAGWPAARMGVMKSRRFAALHD